MKAFFCLLLPCVLMAATLNGHASQESTLPLSSFRLEAGAQGTTGNVVIEGSRDEKGELTDLKITAFGKAHAVNKEHLAPLSPLTFNGVRISQEPGYAITGGRTVYVVFQIGFTSTVKKETLLTLTENGKVTLTARDLAK